MSAALEAVATAVRQRETEDLPFAAYAHYRGLKILCASVRLGPNSIRYRFQFDDPDGRWRQLEIDFANSEARAYDLSVRTLKKLGRDE